jgi:hypothetical protein
MLQKINISLLGHRQESLIFVRVHSRILARLNLAAVAQLAKPPKVVLHGGCLGIADEISARVRKRVVRIVQAGVEDADLARADP